MRASRLLTILMILQARGRVTAQALADECEMSLRTIYRDVDALSASGVPVYSDRGSTGGYRLLEGYRTRLNGFSPREAEAMFLSGLSGPAASLGLGAAMAAAQLKMTTALPPEMRSAADRMRTRFHLDAPGWFQSAEEPEHLQSIAAAVWEERLVEIRYRSWKAESERRVAPLGIVPKAAPGIWSVLWTAASAPIASLAFARCDGLRAASRAQPSSILPPTGATASSASKASFTRVWRPSACHRLDSGCSSRSSRRSLWPEWRWARQIRTGSGS